MEAKERSRTSEMMERKEGDSSHYGDACVV
jgi:hypothetical protein